MAGFSTALSSALSSYISAEATASHTSGAQATTLTTTVTSAGTAATVTQTLYPAGTGPTGSNYDEGPRNNFPNWAIAPIVIGAIILFFLIWLVITKFRHGYFGLGIKRWQRIRRTRCDQCGRLAKGPCSYCTPIFNPAAEAEAARGFQQPQPTKRGADIALEEFYRSEHARKYKAPPGGFYGPARPRQEPEQPQQPPAPPAEGQAQDGQAPQDQSRQSRKNYLKFATGRMNQPLYF